MRLLLPEQVADLQAVQRFCEQLGTQFVVIGALAYQAFIADVNRETADLDVAVALDMDEFDAFKKNLASEGWRRDRVEEQRWRGPTGSFLDILPAGPKARLAGHITWPESNMRMSLVGFDHVFTLGVERDLAPGCRVKVVPPPVLFVLKVGAFLDDEPRRKKDLEDIHSLLRLYEWVGERLYSGEVFEAELQDIQFAPAFLLGLDVGRLCNADERRLIQSFTARAEEQAGSLFYELLQYEGETEAGEQTLSSRLKSFRLGLDRARHSIS